MLRLTNIKFDFPYLNYKINGKRIIFLDTSSSSQKPQKVLIFMSKFSQSNYSNVHRGSYYSSNKTTFLYEKARFLTQFFLKARFSSEIIFTKGVTDSINLIASTLFNTGFLCSGDEILVSEVEHHSNIIPWHIICTKKKIYLKIIPIYFKINQYDLRHIAILLTKRTKIISLIQCSNVLGNIFPIKKLIIFLKNINPSLLFFIDGAQAVIHTFINVLYLDCDFFSFSSHKLYGPTGVGILYIKKEVQNFFLVNNGGGSMVQNTTMKQSIYFTTPIKYEPGTPNIVGILGFGKTLEYLNQLNFEEIFLYEQMLHKYLLHKFSKFPNYIQILSNYPTSKTGICTFILFIKNAYDLGTFLNFYNIFVRIGFHCCHPLLNRYNGLPTIRVSFGLYNTVEDIDTLFLLISFFLKN